MAQAVADEARAKYEASLATLRTFINDFPAIAQRVEEHDERLSGLEARFAELRREISTALSETPDKALVEENLKHPETPPTYGRISFCAEEKAEWQYDHEEHDAIVPVHGHWLPTDSIKHRESFQGARDSAKQLGGRVVMLEPKGIEDVESMECVMVEPMGRILSMDEFVSTGLVICIDGDSHESDKLEAWGEVLKASKWLDCGISFALPDVSNLAEAGDVERVVEAVLAKAGFQTCILTGKDWGATIISEIAGRSRLSERIDGVLLVAPESPAPMECCYIETPVMVIWAENDEVSPFCEIREWFEVLRERSAPTFVRDLAEGGHDFGKLLKEKKGEVAQEVLHFTVSCLLMGLLMKAMDEGADKPSEACARLCDDLPYFLASQIGGDAEAGVAAAISSSDPARVQRRMERLQSRLKDWIQEGMVEMASATE